MFFILFTMYVVIIYGNKMISLVIYIIYIILLFWFTARSSTSIMIVKVSVFYKISRLLFFYYRYNNNNINLLVNPRQYNNNWWKGAIWILLNNSGWFLHDSAVYNIIIIITPANTQIREWFNASKTANRVLWYPGYTENFVFILKCFIVGSQSPRPILME